MQLTIFINNFTDNEKILLDYSGTIDLLLNNNQESHKSMLLKLKEQYEDMIENINEYQNLIPISGIIVYDMSLEFVNSLINVYTNNKTVELIVYE